MFSLTFKSKNKTKPPHFYFSKVVYNNHDKTKSILNIMQ